MSYNESTKTLQRAGISTIGLDKQLIISVAEKWKMNNKLFSDEIKQLDPSIPKFFRNSRENSITCLWKMSNYLKWLNMGLFEYVSANDDVDFYCSFMGAYDFASWFKGSVEILVHGTTSCINSYRMSRMDNQGEKKFYCSGMEDKEAIFGGRKKLLTSIQEIYKRKKPEVLIILTTCASDIIGEDIVGISNECKDLNMKIVAISTGGCSGSGFREGAKLVLKKILEIIPVSTKKQDSVNILYFPMKNPDVQNIEMKEITQLLLDFGITINMILAEGTNFEELYKIAVAKVTVGICPTKSDSFMDILVEKCSQKALKLMQPIGYWATEEWVHELGDAMGIELTKTSLKLDEMKNEALYYIEKYNLIGKRVVVFLPPGRSFPIARFFKHLGANPIIMGIKPYQLKVVSSIVEKMVEKKEDIDMFLGGFTELINYLGEDGGEEAIIITRKKMPIFNEFPQVCLDFFYKPLLGATGQSYILKQLDKAMDTYGRPDCSLLNSFYPEICHSPEEVVMKSSCRKLGLSNKIGIDQKIKWSEDML